MAALLDERSAFAHDVSTRAWRHWTVSASRLVRAQAFTHYSLFHRRRIPDDDMAFGLREQKSHRRGAGHGCQFGAVGTEGQMAKGLVAAAQCQQLGTCGGVPQFDAAAAAEFAKA